MKQDKSKPGPKPRDTCKKGHDISKVGRSKSRNCNQCQKEYYEKRRDFLRKHFNEKLS
jgi:hypothetical protein